MNARTRCPTVQVWARVVCAWVLIWGGAKCPEPLPYPIAEVQPSEIFPGGDTTNRLLMGSNAFIRPAANFSQENEALFYSGNSWFNQNFVEAPATTRTRDGLGPLFNAKSCSGCHFFCVT